MTNQTVKIIDKVDEYVLVYLDHLHLTKTKKVQCNGLFHQSIDDVVEDLKNGEECEHFVKAIKATTRKVTYHFPVDKINFPDDREKYCTRISE